MTPENGHASLLVMGIGNPILTDDSIGLKIVRALKERRHDLNIAESMETGVGMMDVITGYKRLIIIDSIKTGRDRPGALYKFTLPAENPINMSCAHGVDIMSAIMLGRTLGYKVPEEVIIFAVEIADNTTFGEICTPAVNERQPFIIDEILSEVDNLPASL
jgi:hydrogenase maturation protease